MQARHQPVARAGTELAADVQGAAESRPDDLERALPVITAAWERIAR